ncbi:MAG: phenylacetate--CoA ligase [Desulfobacula sp.]|uniref:phenylacetate--CoA ligase family protein n=1 Tax=Desulfobacula sp. TaxID=2593537 RepID=UPI001DF04FBC|nr:phenylacetate--CoA ligase [Desulfobacula sp.]MBT3486664.1 phenylacetate--CoA ligase [Desulfobacula sp.]MBT4026657.1 phenylacetate--CoA ligase [Desulfobacula sp.]MBT4200493.1 phenylacetate--CoA ligase [Desulfobacula sp.]MBT4506597.1 phenylacetate--CoA ligase [Desulfobacula sp.]
MEKAFMPRFENREQLFDNQLEGLKWTVSHVFNGSAFYRKNFVASGVMPEDIKCLDDISKLPFTMGKDLKDGYPLPLLSVPQKDVVRVHASSGTTGKRKILSYTQTDLDIWFDMFARCYEMAGLTKEDRVQIAVGYGVWTAGMGFQLGCERFGAMAIPVGPGNIDMQCQFLLDMQSTVLCCTASMALLMAEEVNKRGIKDKINLKKIIMGSERCSAAMHTKIKDLLGLEDMFDITGMTELYGPGMGLDCPKHEGIHYWADKYILEILNPDTLKPVEDGEVGEMVVTTLNKEASPLVRYRTRDLTRKISTPCSCGNILPLHDRIMGRSDDMIILRGVNIYPGQIDEILSSISDVGSEYQLHLERKDDGKDYMTIKVEASTEVDSTDIENIKLKIIKTIQSKIMVSCNAQICAYGELPRVAGKTRRIFDNRE